MGVGLDKSPLFSSFMKKKSCWLRFGDSIVLYSDGVTEARHPEHGEFDYHRLASVAAGLQGSSAEENVEDNPAFRQRIHGKNRTDDDITMVVLRWKGHQAASAITEESASVKMKENNMKRI